MAMGRQKDGQGDLMVSWSEMPRSPGHVFYDRLQSVLIEGGFDAFAEASCRPYYAARMGAPSVPPGRYFRMHLVGYFEGIDSERGLEWRCSDSLSLRAFLRLGSRDRVPDHSWLSRSRTPLPHEVHAAVFDWVLVLIAEAGLIKDEPIGVDASTMEANAALRNIVRRDNGEGPANTVLQESIAHLLTRPVGRPPNHGRRYYANFGYQAGSWNKKRRVVAKVEWHPGELYPRVGFIVTNLSRPAERVVAFYNQRGTAEQWIKEGKNAIKWTRLSCRKFDHNAVRLQLHALAYNLGNFMRQFPPLRRP